MEPVNSSVKSSYFPQSSVEESEINDSSNFMRPRLNHIIPDCYTSKLPTTNEGVINFPNSKSILWDRTGLAPPIELCAADIIPSIVLAGKEVVKLLSLLDPTQPLKEYNLGGSFNANAYVHHICTLPEQHQLLLRTSNRVVGNKKYFLSFERHSNEDLQLTVPISRNSDSLQSME